MQTIAHNAGHPVPLAIALDQENGGVNSLFDPDFVQQFPSQMGIAATGSTDLAYEVAKATAVELGAVGINWIMGPCLDVLTNIKNQPLGVRSTGDDADEVSRFGVMAMKGSTDAGLLTCGKHFPSYGNLEFLGSSLDVPVITDSLEQLSLSALAPFRDAIANHVDAIMVGGCAMSSAGVEAMHACLSNQVVDGLLRQEMGFKGVVMSECLEMEALSNNIGVGGGTVMAVNAGCDLILVCRSFTSQKEAFNGLKAGLENGVITQARVQQSLNRMLLMKVKCVTWEKALAPGGIDKLTPLQPTHAALSERAYNTSITVVRDKERLLPLSNILDQDEELLLLSPLVKPLPASAASRALNSSADSPEASTWQNNVSGMSGEWVFQEMGRSLARQRGGRVLHTSYNANGVRPVHENLINRASAVIVVTADAGRNLYQYGFAKHVSMICKMSQLGEKREKPLVVVAVSSPYDFAMDSSLGTYVCTFDFTETALQALVKLLSGELSPTGTLPGSLRQNHKVHQSKQYWLVEHWDRERDAHGLDALLMNIQEESRVSQRSILAGCTTKTFLLNTVVDEAHFVVRNSSTQALYGFCSTYYFESTGTGVVGPILVDPERRNLSIARSLHTRAAKILLQKPGIKRLQFGSRIPSVFLGIPSSNNSERKRLRQWCTNLGWSNPLSRSVCSMQLSNLQSWTIPERLLHTMQHTEVAFDLIQGMDHAGAVLDLVQTSSRQGIMEIYGLALADQYGCSVIRAKRTEDGALLGTIILYNGNSSWADAVPAVKDHGEFMGGLSSPVISPSAGEFSTLLQGLILLGIRQHQKQLATAVLLDYVSVLDAERSKLT